MVDGLLHFMPARSAATPAYLPARTGLATEARMHRPAHLEPPIIPAGFAISLYFSLIVKGNIDG